MASLKKSIKICDENWDALEAALDAVNGDSRYGRLTPDAVIAVADAAENRLYAMLGRRRDIEGASVFTNAGGNPLAWTTGACLLRKSGGWHLTTVYRAWTKVDACPDFSITLTSSQDLRAVEVLRTQYRIQEQP